MRVLLMLCCALALAACSEPECAESERKIGATCVPRPRDGGVRDAAISESSSAVDAQTNSTRDARTDADTLAVTEGPDGSPDAASSTATAACGDGLVSGAELCDSRIAEGQLGACPTQASCKSTSACLMGRLVGTADKCDAACASAPLTACAAGDGCCPSGCTTANDNDCSASCGNGVVDTGETCEAKVGAGCPTSCAPVDSCHPRTLTGSAANCNALCTESAATGPSGATKDGCCPGGATFTNDQDCPGCGDHVVQAPELCDGNCPTSCAAPSGCVVNQLQGSACGVQCVATTITQAASGDGCCPAGANHNTDAECPAVCGNRVVESGEKCDDGNGQAGDGCNACQLDDNTATPGDDRVGYVSCVTLTCGPGQACKLTALGGGKFSGACATAGPERRCDGPEDCPTDSPLCRDYPDYETACTTKASCQEDYECGTISICHADRDCASGEHCVRSTGVIPDGYCGP